MSSIHEGEGKNKNPANKLWVIFSAHFRTPVMCLGILKFHLL